MLQIYNTLSRKKEEFEPLNPPQVSFYQCGPTVYWVQHLGNMRAMVLADLIRRSLVYLGYKVNFARNYTDVGHLTSDEDEGEDKMIKAAKRDQLSPEQVAEKYILQFENDVADLNCLPPDSKPRATEYIQQMQEMVQTLLDKNFAYATDLAIYFDITKATDYTKLSGQKLEMNKVDAGKGEVGDTGKKNPADFSIWFFKAGAHANALQVWDYKFKLSDNSIISGQGFPGWHLECSAMNYAIFGPTIDIHMGGIEHVPVHHTNEIAQSEAFSGQKFARYWIHNEHLTVDGGKMAKSAGTSYSLQDVIDKGYDPLVLRYFFLGAHYRSKQNFTWEALESAKISLNKLYREVSKYFSDEYIKKDSEMAGHDKFPSENLAKEYVNFFKENISSDFNMPGALADLWAVVGSHLNVKEKIELVQEFDKVFGLNILENAKKIDDTKAEEIPENIKTLAEARWAARQNKDWGESDRLREELEAAGWQMEDGKDSYKLKKS